jgi:hypothetical protein
MSFSNTYLERVIDASRSHSVFNKEWSTYYSRDFADTFLPFSKKFIFENVRFYDALELISGIEIKNGVSLLEVSNVSVFTFHKDSDAARIKQKVSFDKNELALFVQLLNENTVQVNFKFGEHVRNQISSVLKSNEVKKSTLDLEATTFNFTIEELKASISTKTSSLEIINFALKTFGVELTTLSLKEFDKMIGKAWFNSIPNFEPGFSRKKNPGTWTHGDIEKYALKKFFSESEISKIYYGNWLRDYSSVITGKTVGFDYKDRSKFDKEEPFVNNSTVRDYRIFFPFCPSQKSWIKVIRLLATKDFVYNTKKKPSENIREHQKEFISEFGDPTINIVGIYRPEEHIDNPKGLIDESILGHSKLIDPIRFTYEKSDGKFGLKKLYPEVLPKSLEINPNTMMKRYIKEDIDELRPSSFTYFSEQLKLAKKHGKTNKGFRHFGAAMHVLEDFYAHSNFVEVCLIKLGNTKVYPWVDLSPEVESISDSYDKASKIPIVTGNFGQLDIIASLAPKVADGFLAVEYKDYKKLKSGYRTFMDEIIIITLEDCIQKEEGMPEDQKAKVISIKYNDKEFKVGYKELLTTYLEFLEIMDQIRKLEEIPVIGSVITLYKQSKDLISQTIELLFTLPLNLFVNTFDNLIKARQTQTTKIGTDPSHTQLAKDSHEHPLNGLAGYLAFLTVGKIGEDMANCWKTGKPKIETIIETAKDRYFVHPCFTNWPDNEIKKWVKNNSSKVDDAQKGKNFYDHGFEAFESLKKALKKTDYFKDANK